MKRNIYIAHYDNENIRDVAVSGITVMDYLIESMEKISNDNIIISPAGYIDGRKHPRIEKSYSSKTLIIYMPSYPRRKKWNIPGRAINKIKRNYNLYKELKRIITTNSCNVIAYHSPETMDVLRKLKKNLDFNFILQICEVYGDAYQNDKLKAKEHEYFKLADKYICQSELLNDLINTEKKPSAILYGSYKQEKQTFRKLFNDNKIHCVYAGTLDRLKYGAYAAIELAEYLPSDYHVHILGFGTDSDIASIKSKIREISARTDCSLTYDGVLRDNPYKEFLQSCNISLCTQNPNEDFNNTSFPSKILVYMANGLKVVTVDIPAIRQSEVSKDMFYCSEYTPKTLAESVIKATSSDSRDSIQTISNLDKNFILNFKNLLN